MLYLMPWQKRGGSEVVSFKSELDNLFKRFFDIDFPMSREFMKEGVWAPRVDLSEGEKEITVKVEIPGCDAKDIDVTIEGHTLVIRGEKKQESEESNDKFHRVERSFGSFSRVIELPVEVDQNKVDAIYKKGVLTLTLNKSEETERKQIEIKTS